MSCEWYECDLCGARWSIHLRRPANNRWPHPMMCGPCANRAPTLPEFLPLKRPGHVGFTAAELLKILAE